MDRAGLEKLSRDDLISHAERVGVERARILTRPELVDEILLATIARSNKRELKKARGFFGIARDLITRVVERGLHLPDAAERIRSLVPPPPTMNRPPGAALPTVTLAEIYASQGHTDRAVETLRRVLAIEPEHAAAHALLEKLDARDYVPPAKPALPPEVEREPDVDDIEESLETIVAIASAAPPAAAPPLVAPPVAEKAIAIPAPRESLPLLEDTRVDAVDAIPLEDGTLSVHYSVSVDTLACMLTKGRPLTLRVLRFYANPAGTTRAQTDLPVQEREGRFVLKDLPAAGNTRVALGWLDKEGAFHSVAHAPLLEGAPPTLFRWLPSGSTPVAVDAAKLTRAAREAIALDRRPSQSAA